MRIKLPYRLFTGMVTDNTEDCLCFSDGLSCLCVDAGRLKSILRRCHNEQKKDFILSKIFRSINERVNSGQFSGKITFEV